MADILCDASSLISLTRTCFGNVLSFLHNASDARFFITPAVEKEMIERPLKMKRRIYALSALRLKNAMNKKVLLRIDADLGKKTSELLKIANNIFFTNGKPMTIVHTGEMELIALANHLNLNNLLIDERTTRMLIESPFVYKKHLEHEFKVNVMIHKKNLSLFREHTQNLKIIRSSELLVVAYENGFMSDSKSLKKEMLDAGLHALKYSGCSIRFDEIARFMKKVN